MADWTITVVGLTEVRTRLDRAAGQVRTVMAQMLARGLDDAVVYARDRYLSGGTTADRLAVRTGGLRQAFTAQVEGDVEGVTGRIGYLAGTPTWASVHEGWPDGRTSTTIRPTHGQYLAIPLPGAGLAPGGPVGRPRDLPNSFVARSKRGNLLIFERTAEGIMPRYLLRTEVVIPSRPALRPTMAVFTSRIVAAVGTAMAELVGGTHGSTA